MLLCFSGLIMAHAVLNDIEQLIDELDRDADEEVTLNTPFYQARIDKALLIVADYDGRVMMMSGIRSWFACIP